jgi:glucose-1-phosphatase
MDVLVTDVGDVLLTTLPGKQYVALARLANLSSADVAVRFHSAGISSTFDRGLLSTREFAESVGHLLGCRVGAETLKRAWRAVIGTVDGAMAEAVRPLARQRRLLLASNTDAIHWPIVRDRLAEAGIVAPAALSFELGIAKPSSEFFKVMMRKYLDVPSQAGYIDDQTVNVEAALEAGLQGIVHTTVASTVRWIRSSMPQVDLEDLPLAMGVDPSGDQPVHDHRAAALADLDGQRVGLHEPVRPRVQRPGPELLHRRVQALGQLGHLRLRQAGDPQRLGQLLHPPRRHTQQVQGSDHADQRLLGRRRRSSSHSGK